MTFLKRLALVGRCITATLGVGSVLTMYDPNLGLDWLRESMLEDLFDYLSEQGDVLSFAVLCLVLESEVPLEELLGKKRMQQNSMWYIDLLHRLRLWDIANETIKRNPDDAIRQMNMVRWDKAIRDCW